MKKTDEELRAIILPIWDADHSLEQVAEACSLSNYRAMYRVALRLGIGHKPRHPRATGPARVDDVDREKLAALWAVVPLKKLPKHLGRSVNVITRTAQEMGLPPKPPAEAYFDEEPEGAALADLLYRIGETAELISDIARDHNMGRRTAVQLAKRHGVVRSERLRNAVKEANRKARRQAAKAAKPLSYDGLKSLMSVAPTDPDVKTLMRFYVPVCRAKTVDPNADPSAWIVGRQVMAEQDMRALAARKSQPGMIRVAA